MKLKRVIYELYEIDLVSLHDQSEWHEIDREIFLEFDNGEKMYFSWCNEPVQFSIGSKNHRFNENQPDHIVDASGWDIWKDLIGDNIQFTYKETHQILEVKGQSKSVYLSSQEKGSWYADVLHISDTLPVFNC
ncbi:MAG: hypothetical protein COA86_11115 [Kangiella sp.]|nr:MAG: hypothetical protein COA86_11115 [Kangiella sp.]